MDKTFTKVSYTESVETRRSLGCEQFRADIGYWSDRVIADNTKHCRQLVVAMILTQALGVAILKLG